MYYECRLDSLGAMRGLLCGGKAPVLQIQHPWAPFECYVLAPQLLLAMAVEGPRAYL